MDKNNQNPGKKLSRSEMKKLNGGSALQPCDCTADCYKPCDGIVTKGNFCVNGVCRYMSICPPCCND
jgi:hypothetical protein